MRDGQTETVHRLKGFVREPDGIRGLRGRLVEFDGGLLEIAGLVKSRGPQGRALRLIRPGLGAGINRRILAPAGAGTDGEQA